MKKTARTETINKTIDIPKIRESLIYRMQKRANELNITLGEACEQAIEFFCSKG